jgi:D-alanyl-D-alanine dipeptidase
MALPASSTQALVVAADSPAGTTGRLTLYERDGRSGPWRHLGKPLEVALGRGGLASADRDGIPKKREGDGATPTGTFSLEYAFGRAAAFPTRLPYLALSRSTEAVDDPASRFYNRIVDRRAINRPDWKSAEQMFREDPLYDLGVVVGYNTRPAVPGKGSCIFLHIWKSPGSPTSGCIAMSRRNLGRIVEWLDPAARPVIAISPGKSSPPQAGH